MADNSFFTESFEQSQIKSKIVSDYFWSWAKVVTPSVQKQSGKIAYIDLFSGPGRYKDGTKSTPLLILENAIKDSTINQMLLTIFNDINSDNSNSLQNVIDSIVDLYKLKYKPQIFNLEVGQEMLQTLKTIKFCPSLIISLAK